MPETTSIEAFDRLNAVEALAAQHIPEAPTDSQLYARGNMQWVPNTETGPVPPPPVPIVLPQTVTFPDNQIAAGILIARLYATNDPTDWQVASVTNVVGAWTSGMFAIDATGALTFTAAAAGKAVAVGDSGDVALIASNATGDSAQTSVRLIVI
jgi:hypothetical protein